MASPRPIFPLPPSVRDLLRSTTQLPSVPSIVTQLVYNALDAGAANIEVSLDLSASTITCRDDGRGFPVELLAPTDYTTHGVNALQRYVSSRRVGPDSTSYGIRGEALASMAAIGLLTVETTLSSDSASPLIGTRWTTMQRGSRLLYSGPSSRLYDGAEHAGRSASLTLPPPRAVRGGLRGSEVTVRDLFHELPLRRPSRLDASAQRAQVDQCRRALIDVALREPGVAFILRSSSGSASDGLRSRADDKIILRCEKAPALSSRFAQLLLPLSPAQIEEVAFDLPLQSAVTSASSSPFTFHARGFFSLTPDTSKAHQIIYLQGHRLRSELSISEHWSSILGNERIADGGRCAHAGARGQRTLPSQADTASATTPHLRWRSKQDPRRNRTFADEIAAVLSRCVTLPTSSNRLDGEQRSHRSTSAAFLIDLWISRSSGAVCELALEESVLTKAICDEVKRLLRRCGLIPEERGNKGAGASKRTAASPGDRPSTTTSSTARPAKRLRTARPKTVGTAPSNALRTLPTVFPSAYKANAASHKTLTANGKTSEPLVRPPTPEEFCRHTDPDTLKSYFIDLRTGNSYPVSEGPPSEATEARSHGPSQGMRQARQLLKRPESSNSGNRTKNPDTPEWLRETLAAWQSPALAMQPTEPDVPSLALPISHDGEVLGGGSSRIQKGLQTRRALAVSLPNVQLRSHFFANRDGPTHTCDKGSCCAEGGDALPDDSQGNQQAAQRISKPGLKSARIISQLAQKFIVCLVPGDHDGQEEVLVCIDQHAADERVRFEAILEEYSTTCEAGAPLSHELKAPVPVWLPRIQAQQLVDVEGSVAASLAYWGFGVAVEEHTGGRDEGIATSTADETKLKVTHVPSPVADRLRQEVDTLRSVLLDFLDFYGRRSAFVAPKPSSPGSTRASGPAPPPAMHSARLHQIPPALLALFKSKACRGAIMFNDELSTEQCHRLVVEQLAHTAFPFQCAHGRPSMVPLCSVGAGAGRDGGQRSARRVDWSGIGQLG